MTTSLYLPLELRSMVYDYALHEEHDYLTNGVPALFKVYPNITAELYSYRKTITTMNITTETPWPLEHEIQHFDKITRFKQKQYTKGLVVKFRCLKPRGQQVPSSGLPGFIASIRETLRGGHAVLRVLFYAMRLGLVLDVETEVIDEDCERSI
ncbi:hypothetical protein KCU65_g2151, partial [Aureobasidium melanogenum]